MNIFLNIVLISIWNPFTNCKWIQFEATQKVRFLLLTHIWNLSVIPDLLDPQSPPQTQRYPIFGSAVRQLRNARLAHTIVLFNDHCHCFVILSFCLALVTLQIQLPMRDKCARIIWTGMCGKRSLSPQGHALSDSRRESAMWREVCGVGIQLILILVKSKCAEAGTKFIG